MNFLLIAIILVNLWITYKGLNDYAFFERYKFNVGSVKQGEYYRLISGAFLHAGWGHLAANMITLFFFMPVIEKTFGSLGAISIYFVSLLAGNLLTFYFHKNHDWYSAVGNSGAVNGVLFASILIYPDMNLYIIPFPIPIPSIVYGIGYLLYTTYGMQHQTGNIGHEAHFGGAAAGMLTTILYKPFVLFKHPLLSLLLGLIIVGGFLWIKSKK